MDRFEALAPRALDWSTIAIFFFGFAGQGFRNIVGIYDSGYLLAVLFVVFALAFAASDKRIDRSQIPKAPLAFVGVCVASLAWSEYPLFTAMGAVVTVGVTGVALAIANAYTWRRLVDLLIIAFQGIFIVSYALELYVSLILRHPLAPISLRSLEKVPEYYIWVNDSLLQGGPIQGFMGNRNPFAFVALLLLLLLLGRWVDTRQRTASTLVWSALAILTVFLTRSSTVSVIVVMTAAVAIAFVVVSYVPYRKRRLAVSLFSGTAVLLAGSALVAHRELTDLLGRSSDMSGRGEIWRTLLPLIAQRPLFGWGWTIGWPRSHPMFATLCVRWDGTPADQAHNSYIEALFQTGFLGASVLTCAVFTVFIGAFIVAKRTLERSPIDCVPALLMTALFIQSLVESRLLFEGNWLLFVILATVVLRIHPYRDRPLKPDYLSIP